MAIFVRIEYLDTKAQINIDWHAEEMPSTATIIETEMPIPSTAATPVPTQLAESYNPVAIILAICALITAVSKAIHLNRAS